MIQSAFSCSVSHDQGHAQSQSNLGVLLMNGEGIAMDKAAAAHSFKLAADQGDSDGQYRYGILLYRRNGIAADEAEGLRYLRLAAGQGQADASPELRTAESDSDLQF
jgi:TPR repeat protein